MGKQGTGSLASASLPAPGDGDREGLGGAMWEEEGSK